MVIDEHLVNPATTLPSIRIRNLNLRNGSAEDALGGIESPFCYSDHPLPSFMTQGDALDPDSAGTGFELRQGCVFCDPATIQLVAGNWLTHSVIGIPIQAVHIDENRTLEAGGRGINLQQQYRIGPFLEGVVYAQAFLQHHVVIADASGITSR